MNHLELKAARETLRLTPQEMAQMLDLSSAKPVYRWEMAPDHSTATPPPTRVVRLIRAYLAGYRPDDWPERVKKEEARIAALREHQASLGI